MALIQFDFTPEENVKSFPKPIHGKYELISLEIEADSMEGLAEAIRKMRIYFRFDFGSNYSSKGTATYHLSKYIIAVDQLNYTINFNSEEIIEIDPKHTCTNAIASIMDNVEVPVIKMTLTLNHH
ncbi:MAG: hypothetical protein HWE22_13935 [Flavobacteriales bacterium]|nr:hypothetical protein [Flavobacteriales bacterium]